MAIKDWGIEGLSNPVAKLRMPKGSKERDRRPTAKELKEVIKAAGEIHAEMPAIIEIAVETAMRRSELLTLRRENVKAKHALLEDTKNGTRRLVPLSHCFDHLLPCQRWYSISRQACVLLQHFNTRGHIQRKAVVFDDHGATYQYCLDIQ
ncbi:Tyrosine recombinase XerC [compost metagenome]